MTNDTPVESSYALLLKSAKNCKFAQIEIFVANAKNEVQNYEHIDLNHKNFDHFERILIEIVNILNEDMNILNEIKKMFIKIVNILNKIIKF